MNNSWSSKSFSQCGEDYLIMNLITAFAGRDFDYETFRYVDIGACLPDFNSNTWAFYQLGSRGLIVEPNSRLATSLREQRPRDRFVNAAARSSDDTELVTLRTTNDDLVSSTNGKFLDAFLENKSGKVSIADEIEVPTVEIQPLIEEVVREGVYGLLSIDTEGTDLEILKRLDISHTRPWFIILEPSSEIVGADLEAEMDAYLRRHNYEKILRTRVNAIYRDASLKGLSADKPEDSDVARFERFIESQSKTVLPVDAVEAYGDRYERILSAFRDPNTAFVSFDVFDTALLRPVMEPHELFLFLDRYAREKLGLINFHFSEERRRIERELRLSLQAEGKNIDPTLDDIYAQMALELGLDAKALAEIEAAEIQLEIKSVYANPAIIVLFEKALEFGKKVIFCSDSYFSDDVIRTMLHRAGYNGETAVYSSSHLGVTKKHGTFFPYICEHLGVEPSSIVHIGDNQKSDVDNAKAAGVRPFRYLAPRDAFLNKKGQHRKFWQVINTLDFPTQCGLAIFANKYLSRTYFERPERSLFDGSHERFGYYALGPILYWLANWMRRESAARGIDHLYFLARDGHLPYQAWNILFGDDETVPRASYLLISRRSILPINIKYGDPIAALFDISVAPNLTVRDFLFSRLEDDLASKLCSKLDLYGVNEDSYVKDAKDALKRLVADMREEIHAGVTATADRALRYFQTELAQSDRPAIFDVGRKGTFQNVLSRVLQKHIFGMYMLTQGNVHPNMRAANFQSAFPQVSRRHHKDEPDTIIYECLLSKLAPSVVGWNENLTPISDVNTQLHPSSARIVENIQRGALEFVSDMRMHFGNQLDNYPQNVRNANHLLQNFWEFKDDAELFRDLYHEDSLSRSSRKSLLDYYGGAEVGVRPALKRPSNDKPHLVIYCPAFTRIRGGIERVVSILSFHITAKDRYLTILTSGREDVPAIPVYPVPEGTNVVHIRHSDREAVYDVLSQLAPDALVVMASGPSVAQFVHAANTLGIPIMLSERAEPHASIRNYWIDSGAKNYLKVYGAADMISVQLETFRPIFDAKFSKKTVVLPNPISTFENHQPAKDRENRIVCVGRLNFNQKRQDLLLEAFRRVADDYPDWSLEFYGATDSPDAIKLADQISVHELDSQVRIIAPVDDLGKVYAKAAICAVPSAFEGFPNVLAEALSMGLPAIGFQDCPGTNELIVHGKNGLLVGAGHNEVEGLAEALNELMSEPGKRAKMGEAAIQHIAENYNNEAALAEWDSAIDQLLKIDKAPARSRQDLIFALNVKKYGPGYPLAAAMAKMIPNQRKKRKLLQSPKRFFADSSIMPLRILRFGFRQ